MTLRAKYETVKEQCELLENAADDERSALYEFINFFDETIKSLSKALDKRIISFSKSYHGIYRFYEIIIKYIKTLSDDEISFITVQKTTPKAFMVTVSYDFKL